MSTICEDVEQERGEGEDGTSAACVVLSVGSVNDTSSTQDSLSTRADNSSQPTELHTNDHVVVEMQGNGEEKVKSVSADSVNNGPATGPAQTSNTDVPLKRYTHIKYMLVSYSNTGVFKKEL